MMENLDDLDESSQLNSSKVNTDRIITSDYATHEVGGDLSDNSTVVEMLTQIKQLIEESWRANHIEIKQVTEENDGLKQRLDKLEFQTADIQMRLVDFETRLITVEDNMAELGKVMTELKPAFNKSFLEKFDKRADEIRDESRRYLVENFSKFMSALESLERRAEYVEVHLQFLLAESNTRIAGVERVQSTNQIIFE